MSRLEFAPSADAIRVGIETGRLEFTSRPGTRFDADQAASHAWGTFSYPVGYRLVIGLAPAASVLAQRLLRPARVLAATPPRWWRALVLGIATSPRTSAIRPQLGILSAWRPGAPALPALLVGVHFLKPYHLLLVGPLLGRDVLLSHLIGTALCFAVVGSNWRAAGDARHPGGAAMRDETVVRLALLEVAGTGPRVVGGLVLAGVVGAPGDCPRHVSSSRPCSAEACARRWRTRPSARCSGWRAVCRRSRIYSSRRTLWKTGIAHAGLVSFVLASAASLTRRRLYRAALGDKAGSKLWSTFLTAGFLAGIATAVVFRALGRTIHYRLTREQLRRRRRGRASRALGEVGISVTPPAAVHRGADGAVRGASGGRRRH